MFLLNDDWNSVTGEELEGFLGKIGTIDGRHETNASSTTVAWRPLSFYDQVVLIRVKDPAWVPEKLYVYYLANQGQLTRLDGTSPPIHMVNAEAPIRITEDNVLDYLRFFCYFVRGEEGPFLICEDMDNPAMPHDAMDDSTRKAIENVLRPATFEGKNGEGFFMCDGVVFYSNALFLANFAIQPSGMIEMLDDDPILHDLPVRVDSPVS